MDAVTYLLSLTLDGYERLVTLMFDGYNEGWWLPTLRQEVESTRGVLHIFSSDACCQLLVSVHIGHDIVLYQFLVVCP